MTDTVEELLKTKGVYYSFSGKDLLTKCFNPDHTDTHPSFRIDRISGIAHCFSCGWKCNVFKHFGILTNNVSIRVAKLKEKLQALKETMTGLDPIKGARDITTPYRGISVKTLKHFEMFNTTLDPIFEDRIVFPVKDIRDKVTAYVARHTLSGGNPRYIISPAGATVNVYPLKLEGKPKNIILVEGSYDLLNMYDKGAKNVVCTFGTTKLYSDTAEKLFPFKVMGVEKIFILFDGDDAGKLAAEKTKPLIEECGFNCEIINIPDGIDPGELGYEDIQDIIEYTK